MWKRHTPSATARTSDEGRMFWRARDAYRIESMLYGCVGAMVLIEGLVFLCTGQWDGGLVTVGATMLVCGGSLWLVRQLARRVQTWARTWWRGVGLVVLLALGSSGLLGCEPMAREVAKLHGVTVDPFPGQCAPESVQAGHCVAVKQGGGK